MKTIKIVFNDRHRSGRRVRDPKHGRFKVRTELDGASREEVKEAIDLLQFSLDHWPSTAAISGGMSPW
jgi:hypothetical protein